MSQKPVRPRSKPNLQSSSNQRMINIGYRRQFTPLRWNRYFSSHEDIQVSGNSFRVYKAGERGPVLILLHSIGSSALSWALFTASITKMIKCRVIAIDVRGHGETQTTNDADLKIEIMTDDIADVIQALCGEEDLQLVIVGHSMGGIIAMRLTRKKFVQPITAIIVIDVVEGTPKDTIEIMKNLGQDRPPTFKSIEHAVEWSHHSLLVHNLESARVSVPGNIKNSQTGKLAIYDVPVPMCKDCQDACLCGLKFNDRDGKYRWRFDIQKTKLQWRGWFRGSTQLFLSCKVRKLLILAEVDRLDKSLNFAHMRGEFNLHTFKGSGHSVHEDLPDQLAEVVSSFLRSFTPVERICINPPC